jgi:hypothetical protein
MDLLRCLRLARQPALRERDPRNFEFAHRFAYSTVSILTFVVFEMKMVHAQ